MEDLVSMCERRCRKACNLRSAAEDSDEACHSGSSGGRARRYRKRGSPKSAARDAGAMDTDPSPVRLWESEGHSEGYRTAHEPPSEPEMSAPIARAHTAPEPALQHDAEGLERPARARTAPVPRHTGPETDAIGDTPMGEESEVPGTAGCAESGGKHAACHCEHVSFLMGKYPKMGMDAIVRPHLGGVVAGDVGDAIRIDDLRGIKIPYYDGNPSNLDDFILDWEDFAEEVVGEMRGAPRDKWVCRTFPHQLAQDLKEELRVQIREGLIRTEQACLQWLEDEERADAPNQKLEDLWSIPLPLDRGELRVREWNRYLRKYRRCLKLVEDWNEASEIRHLLKDVLSATGRGEWRTRRRSAPRSGWRCGSWRRRIPIRVSWSSSGGTWASPTGCWT